MRRSIFTRWLACVLSLAIIVTSLPETAFAAGSVVESETTTEAATDTTTGTTTDSTEAPYALYEIEEKREADTKHFMMSDGSILACVYSQDVHYEEDGVLKDIDNSLETDTDEDGKVIYRNKENAFHVELPEDIADGSVKYSDDAGYVMFQMVGVTNKKLEKKEKSNSNKKDKTEVDKAVSGITYKSAKKNIDIEYDITGNALKETIVIHKKTKESFVFEIKTSAAHVEKQTDGSLIFYDQKGEAIYIMQSPYMIDSAGELSLDIAVTLEKTKEGYLLAYTPDYEWLSDKSRVYPVRLDPTIMTAVTDRSKVADSYVFSTQYEGQDLRGGSDIINVGKRADSYQLTMRGFIRFELPDSISKNDTVVDAKLHLVQSHGYTNNSGFQIDLLELTSSFDESTVTWPTQPTFDDTIVDCTTVGSGNSIVYNGITMLYDTYNVTKLVSKWHNGATNNGIMLRVHNESESVSATKQVYYFSKNSTYYSSVAKYIEITYRDTVGLEDYWSYTTHEIAGSGMSYINSYNGNLIFTHTDAVNHTNHTAFTITHIYNSALVGENTFYGNGWRLNLQQKMKPCTIDGNDSVKFVYTDGDGTRHYFVELDDGRIVDEDGLGLTYTAVSDTAGILCKVTDKLDNVMLFDTNHNLTEIVDANGNSIDIHFSDTSVNGEYYITAVSTSSGERFELAYDSSYQLVSITDNAERVTTFTASGNERYITYPDDTDTRFTCDNKGYLCQVEGKSGSGIEYEYITNKGRVQRVNLYGSNDV